ncbi:MAG TPA: tetratricopeptide repeat protein [Isosphaeraceae bacterium]|nr:tetratricopeptide repeat protein [Isosphaeraceae bacterium]
MTVRWKPLIVLSGLFLVIALLGVMAMAIVLAPRANALQSARNDREAKNYKHAEIHYKQALQKDGKNPKLLEEMASLYAEWADASPTDRARHRLFRIKYLADAAKYGKQMAGPRTLLLVDAMQQDDPVESVRWAKELLAIDPESTDAHYVLAEEALAATPPKLEEAQKHLELIEAKEVSRRFRTDWLKARLAQELKDDAQLDALLTRARGTPVSPDTEPVDGMALLRLHALDAQRATDPAALSERVAALKADASRLTEVRELPAARIAQLSLELEKVQHQLARASASAQADNQQKAQATELGDSIEEVAESTFKKALASGGKSDLRIYQTYAEHLLARNKRERCLEVVGEALKSPMASMPALLEATMSLREVGVKAALADAKKSDRFTVAEPYIKELIGSKIPYYEGIGHLFLGAVDLEKSGLANDAPTSGDDGVGAAQVKLRDEAQTHLQRAAELLPKVGAAQALYGVGLILTQEPALGRQYLQTALKLGSLEARYQIWAAWSMVQAGYPEDAEPIVAHLLDEVAHGNLGKDLEPTLHMLSGEVHLTRRTPADLKLALAEFEKGIAAGKPASPSVQLRMTQIEVMLGQPQKGLDRINRLRASGQGGAAAEHLAVLTLIDLNKDAEAQGVLAEARRKFPQSGELAALDASLRVKADKAQDADRILADFLAKNPDEVGVAQMRARLLAEKLDRADEARSLLNNIAERSHHSAPLVQLALLDLEKRDYDAVSRTIAKIRSRWRDAAAADQLAAQMAVAQGDLPTAVAYFDAALKKDPSNKVVQLAKAEIERQTGASADAARTLEAIARDKPVKELDQGLSLATAAESALAAQALEEGDYDGAIHRLEDMLRSNSAGVMARPARWQLVTARAAKGDWAAAKREIAALLNDAKAPPSLQERVRAANFYRLHNDDAAARAQLDYVLKLEPANAAAVAVRAFLLVDAKPPLVAEATAMLRKAIEVSKEPAPVFYLMLAAVENITPPSSDGLKRALVVLDQGLKRYPDAVELLKAKYRVLRIEQGQKAALTFVEQAARADAKGSLRRMLAEIYRDEQEYNRAEQEVRALLKENPRDPQLSIELVRLVASQAIQAAEAGNRSRERALNDETAALIGQFRVQFPHDLSFPQAECELAMRQGNLNRAAAVADEVEAIDSNSSVAPLLRARIFASQRRTSEVVRAYGEALKRNPRQPQVRLALAQADLALGSFDDALDQANHVLEADPNQPFALLLKAKALTAQDVPQAQASTNRAQALSLLAAAIKTLPKLSEAYHQTAAIQMMEQKRPDAIATLKTALKEVPEDGNGLAMLVQILSEPRDGVRPPPTNDLQLAKQLAEQYGGPDDRGSLCLALAVGFQKANQLVLALPWAEKAAAKLNSPLAHLTYGSLLLTVAEATADKTAARPSFERAVAEFDLVLKIQPDSIEAVNNKAWILHRYLGNNQGALDLVQGLLRRVDSSALPGEFFDTLGAIQEGLGQTKEAEEAYSEGLRKAPDQPVLNYHMGRLLAGDPVRADKARTYLERAQAGSGRLSPSTKDEIDTLLRRVAP